MPEYSVIWEIDQWAVDPHEAALKAWQARSAPGSQANTFIVTNPATGVAREISLADDDPVTSPGTGTTQRFIATFHAVVTVDTSSLDNARHLLENVDFEVMPLGGPVRLGLVRAEAAGPPACLDALSAAPSAGAAA